MALHAEAIDRRDTAHAQAVSKMEHQIENEKEEKKKERMIQRL